MIPTPPLPEPARNISYPKIAERQLSNGLGVIVIREDHLPKVSVKLALPVGRVHNPDRNLALLQLAVELIKEGTHQRSSREISELMDQLAIHYESDLSLENVLLSFEVLENHREPALELFSDMVCHPSFPEEELDRLKVRWRSNLLDQRSQPGFLAQERIFHSLYPGHPYAKFSIPIQHLESAQRDTTEEIYRSHFLPGEALLIFAGPIDLDQATRLADRFFGGWERQVVAGPEYPPLQPIEGRSLYLVHRPHSVQSKIVVAIRAVPRAHPDAVPLKIVNQILGGGASARLFLNLRETKGYTYGAYSRLQTYRHDGSFLLEASVKADVTSESIQEFLSELDRMQAEPLPSQEELGRCQNELTGAFLRQTERADSVAEMELIRRLYQLPENYYQTFLPTVRAVTVERILEMSRHFLDPQKVLIAVVADRTLVEKDLTAFGEVRVYDTEGNPI